MANSATAVPNEVRLIAKPPFLIVAPHLLVEVSPQETGYGRDVCKITLLASPFEHAGLAKWFPSLLDRRVER